MAMVQKARVLINLSRLREQLLLQINAQLFSDVFQFFQVSIVLLLSLNLVLQTLKNSDSGGIVVDSSASVQSLTNDSW